MINVITFNYDSIEELHSNTFIAIDSSFSCVVIDPSKDYDGILNYIKSHNLTLKGILLTHAHFDHFIGVNRLKEVYDVPIYIGYEDVETLTNPEDNCSYMSPYVFTMNYKVTPVGDNEIIHLIEEDIKVIYTPYHTKGSVCYYLDKSKILFSGDSLFYHGIGRSDLPTGNASQTIPSLKKIMTLDDEVKVYVGHGKNTSIKEERRFLNVYLGMISK